MPYIIEDILQLLQYFRECTSRRCNALYILSPTSRYYEHLHLSKKHCVMEACRKWLRKQPKYKRAMITACSKAMFAFLRHRNIQKLLEDINAILGK